MTLRHNAFATTSAVALVFALTSHAAALDGDAVFGALEAQMERQGFEIDSGDVEVRGNDVSISNLTLTVPDGDDGIQIEQVLLEDVAETGTGSFVIGRAAMPSFTQTREGMTMNFEGAQVEGYFLAGPNETDPFLSVGLYRQMDIGAVNVSIGGNTLFELEGIVSSMSPYEPGTTLEIDATVKDFFIDFTQVPDAKTRSAMTQVGYEQLRGRVTGSGTWDTDTGDLSGQQSIEVDDAATLNIDLSLGGYTGELLAALQQMQKTMKDQSEQAQGMAMLGIMQQLEVGGLKIELVDDSLTGRMLDYTAEQQGTNREGVVAMAKGAMPFLLAQLQNPDFAAKASAAVGAFLDNPGTLTIAAEPSEPVPAAQIMGSAMSSPQALIGTLNVTVTANE